MLHSESSVMIQNGNSRPLAIHIQKQILREQGPNETWTNQLQYIQAIQSLQYAATISPPDISYSTGKLAKYAVNLSLINWVRVKLILQNLRTTVTIRLYLHNGGCTSQTSLVSYTNANYVADENSKSTSGIVIKYR